MKQIIDKSHCIQLCPSVGVAQVPQSPLGLQSVTHA